MPDTSDFVRQDVMTDLLQVSHVVKYVARTQPWLQQGCCQGVGASVGGIHFRVSDCNKKELKAHPRLQQGSCQDVGATAGELPLEAPPDDAALTCQTVSDRAWRRTPGCSRVAARKLAPRLVSFLLKLQPKTPPPDAYRVPVTTSASAKRCCHMKSGMYFGCKDHQFTPVIIYSIHNPCQPV